MLIFWSGFSALVILLVVLATIYGVFLWIRRRRYTRERFAFICLAAIVTLTSMVIISISSNVMPWNAIAVLSKYFLAIELPMADPTLIDYGFLLSVYVMATYTIVQLHNNWHGLRSIEQYHREQRCEPSGVVTEGFYEIRRIALRQPEPKPYTPPDPRDFVPQLGAVTDSLAWKDQARELIRLSSPSYAFDADAGWHDLTSVWVGKNLETDELIFLHPASTILEQDEVARLIDNVKRIAASKQGSVGLMIIAIRGSQTMPTAKWDLTIKIVTETELLDGLVNWSDYLNEIRRQVTVNHLADSELTLKDVYVQPLCSIEGAGNRPLDVGKLLSEWILDRSQRQIALLGGYGQGKSTAALLFTYQMLQQRVNGSRIPLLIELRGTSPRNLTTLQLLGAWSAQYNINPQSLLRLHIAGRLILIFEGFDEMALVGDAEMRLKHFRTLWQFCYPNAKIIITGRPNFFLDETEMRSALGIYKPISGKAYCEALRLLPFDLEQIALSLRAHKESVRSQICSLATNNSRFQELVSRPSLLHIVSVLWEREQLVSKIDQLDSAYIMDLFVRHSYRRQGRKGDDSTEFMALTTPEREYFMKGIAAYMAATRLPNQITGSQLGLLVETLISAAPDSLSAKASAIDGEVHEPLKQRVEASEQGLDHVKTDVRACGLLVDDPAAPGTFRFGHKSFMEFLFAAVLAELINTESEGPRAILKATNASMSNLIHLPVSVDFLAEMLVSDQECDATAANEATGYSSRQKKAADRLMELVLGDTPIVRWFKRCFAFFDCLFKSTLRSLPRSFIRIGIVLVLIIVFFTAWGVRKRYDLSLNDLNEHIRLWLIVIAVIIGPLLAVSTTLVSRPLGLWNLLCKEMGISDEIMHRVVGTWYIPWARKREFDYYLGESSLMDLRRREQVRSLSEPDK